jgi:flagellar biosynthesis protein FlhG
MARVRVLVNQARSHAEGMEVLEGIVNSSRQFRGAVVAPLEPGVIRIDSHVPLAVRGRRPFMIAYPSAAASRGVRRIARALCLERYPPVRTKRAGLRAVLEARFLVSRGGARLVDTADFREDDASQRFSRMSGSGRE